MATKETTTKEVPVTEVNDKPEVNKGVSDIQNVPTVQAQVAPEAKIDPVQPEPPSASDVAEALNVPQAGEPVSGKENRPDLHTVSKSDLEQHPELKDKGLKDGDQIPFGSQKVWKYPTADRSSIVEVEWPRDVTGGKL